MSTRIGETMGKKLIWKKFLTAWLLAALACQVFGIQYILAESTAPSTHPLSPHTVSLTTPKTDKIAPLQEEAATLASQLPSAEDLRVVERSPASQALDVHPLSPVAVSFDRPVGNHSIGGDKAPFTIAPSIMGDGEWVNPFTFVFYPRQSLPAATDFMVTLDPKLTGTDGSHLAQDEIMGWTFTTSKPVVSAISPQPQTSIPPDTFFQVFFSTPMDVQSVAENIRLVDDTGSVLTGSITWEPMSTRLTFVPDDWLVRGVSYSLIISAQARTLAGELLGEETTATYITYPTLGVKSIDLNSVEALELQNNFGSFAIQFNYSLLGQDFAAHITFDPAVDQLSFRLNEVRDTLQVSGHFQPDTTYMLKIFPSLVDMWNQPISNDSPVTFSFSTTPSNPSLVIPRLESGKPLLFVLPTHPILSVEATNLDALEITPVSLKLQDFIVLAKSIDRLTENPPSLEKSWLQDLQPLINQPQTVEVRLSPLYTQLLSGLYYYRIRGLSTEGEFLKNSTPFLVVSSRTNLTIKRSVDSLLVWAVNLDNNKPVGKDREVRVYDSDFSQVAYCLTDKEGLCQAGFSKRVDPASRLYVVMGEPGSQYFAFSTDAWSIPIGGSETTELFNTQGQSHFAYIYSDRQVYLPGERVNLKAVIRLQDNGRYALPTLSKVTINITRAQDPATAEPADLLAAIPVDLSPSGTASVYYDLPAGLPPGEYRMGINELIDISSFKVVNQQKSKTLIKLQSQQSEIQFGEDMVVEGSVAQLSGIPLPLQQYQWHLYAHPHNFNLPGDFLTGVRQPEWMVAPIVNESALVAEGSGITDARGYIRLNIQASELADSLSGRGTQHLELEVYIGDFDQPMASETTSVVLHPAGFYIGVRPDTWSVKKGGELSVAVQSLDWQRMATGTQSLHAAFDQVSWQQPSDTLSEVSLQAIYTPISTVDFQTDEMGRARLAFTPPEPGVYRLQVSGGGALTEILIWADGKSGISLPDLPGQRLPLFVEAVNFRVGQEAHVFVPNPFNTSLVLVSVERGNLLRQPRVLFVSGAGIDLPIKLNPEDVPNVFVSVVLIGNSPNGSPAFRYGFLDLHVEPVSDALTLSAIFIPEHPAPGQEVLTAVRVTDSANQPVQADLSFSVVEKQALNKACSDAKTMSSSFFGEKMLGVLTSLSLAAEARNVSEPGLAIQPDSQISNPICRPGFGSTAFWTGSILSDENGIARTGFTLPGLWSEWVVDIRATTDDTKVGEVAIDLGLMDQ